MKRPLLHFDGSAGTTPTGSLTHRLSSVFGFAANDIWAVGDNGKILHYDGIWSSFAVPALINTNLLAVWGSALMICGSQAMTVAFCVAAVAPFACKDASCGDARNLGKQQDRHLVCW